MKRCCSAKSALSAKSTSLANDIFCVSKFACLNAIHLREAEEKQNGSSQSYSRGLISACVHGNDNILKQLFSSVPVKVHLGEQFLLAVNNAVINVIQGNLVLLEAMFIIFSCILPHSTMTYIIAVFTELVSTNVFGFLNSQSTRPVWRREESLYIRNKDHTGENLNSF